MSRLSYQIPNFTYPDTRPEQIFDKVVAQAKAAEAAGFDRVMAMDHHISGECNTRFRFAG